MQVFKDLNLKKSVFIKVTTASQRDHIKIGDPEYCVWSEKVEGFTRENNTPEKVYRNKAWMYPEFAKITCISIGVVSSSRNYQLKSFVGEEGDILKGLMETLGKINNFDLIGWNIKSFDMPFILKRCIINGVEPNPRFDIVGLKPWEVRAVDIMELWKCTSYTTASLGAVSTALKLNRQ